MQDNECVDFLQWALPHLHMRWPGFRRVRGQVCKRVAKRIDQLGLQDAASYRRRLAEHPEEWNRLDELCRVTVTRFYRDRSLYEILGREVLPQLAGEAQTGDKVLRCWSIGCASGEEPYTLSILWREQLTDEFPDVRLELLATDADARLIERAHRACYAYSVLKNLPEDLRGSAFTQNDTEYCLRQPYRTTVTFLQQDIRHTLPEGPFQLVLCRNLVFTYFDEPLQSEILQQLHARLLPGGWLVLGVHEKPPPMQRGFLIVSERLGLYRKRN